MIDLTAPDPTELVLEKIDIDKLVCIDYDFHMNTKTPRLKEASEARQRIIETAKRLFYAQGYLATGINQVIAESNVAKNTFYYYFPSKESLCVEYLRQRHDAWMGWLREKIKSIKNPESRILGLFDYLLEWMKSCDFRGCAFLNIASEVPDSKSRIREEVRQHKKALQAEIEEMVKELHETSNKHKKLKVKEVAQAIYVMFEGAIVSSQNFNEIWPIEAVRKTVKEILDGGK